MMAGIDIPEMYYLAVSLDLGIRGRSVTQEDARSWVEKLMRDRVALLQDQLAESLTDNQRPRLRSGFDFSFGIEEEDEEEEDEVGL